jgi:cytoskeletal protein CcmA (bactofilin family)
LVVILIGAGEPGQLDIRLDVVKWIPDRRGPPNRPGMPTLRRAAIEPLRGPSVSSAEKGVFGLKMRLSMPKDLSETFGGVGVRRWIVFGLLTVLTLGPATPAWAQDGQATEAFVVLSGRADVPKGQQVGDLVVFHGSSTVDGTVNGSLTAFDAPVTISGRINGDVVVFNGRVQLRSGANVTGDVVSQAAPVVAPGATIGGTSKRVQTNTNWNGFGWVGRLGWWLAVSLSTLVVGLVLLWLVGRGTTRILEAGRTRIGPSIGWGLLMFFGLPVLAVIALATILGIPLGLGLLAALLLIYALGYSAAAWILGRSLLSEPRSWIVAFLVGWAILRVVALIPILGGLVWFAAVVFGLGALAVAIWRARSGRRDIAATA